MDSGEHIDAPGSSKDGPSTISCFVSGEDPLTHAFNVKIQDLSETAVCELKKIIVEKIETAFPARHLELHKVHVEEDDVPRALEFFPGVKLKPATSKLSRHWTPEELSTGHIHLIVVLPSTGGAPKPPVHSGDEVDDVIGLLEKTQLDVIATQREKSSSGWAAPSNFRRLQSTPGFIQNGRPAHQAGLPIGFYHPVFNNFMKNLVSSDPIPVELYEQTRELFYVSQDTYPEENLRNAAIVEHLAPLLGESFQEPTEIGVQPDHMITSRDGTCCGLVETKNEIGTGGCDPAIQAALSYSKYWGDSMLDKVRIQSCCPSLLFAIAGPWMCVLGAVFLDHPVVQPLTDYIWIGNNPQQPSRLIYVARLFHCMSVALKELKSYYNDLVYEDKPRSGRFFPHITQYLDSTNTPIQFFYKQNLAKEDNSKAIFLARTSDPHPPKDIVVKFVRSYNPEAHALLAKHELAPQLLYDGSTLAGGMLVDFDWCGKDGEAVYPVLMNQMVEWAAGMEPGMRMYKYHDDVMFRCL